MLNHIILCVLQNMLIPSIWSPTVIRPALFSLAYTHSHSQVNTNHNLSDHLYHKFLYHFHNQMHKQTQYEAFSQLWLSHYVDYIIHILPCTI